MMREVTPAILREFLAYDDATGSLTWRPRDRRHFKTDGQHSAWHKKYAGKEALTCVTGDGYRSGLLWRKSLLAHRVVWAVVHGEWPPNDIDHINHNRLDNRIENLRSVTRSGNCRNRTKARNSNARRVGVAWNGKMSKWCAVGSLNGRTTHLGSYADFGAACARRAEFEREMDYHPNHGAERLAA